MSSAMPVCGSTGPAPHRRIESAPAARWPDRSPGGLGFMPERIGVDGGECAVETILLVVRDDVDVQVWITRT